MCLMQLCKGKTAVGAGKNTVIGACKRLRTERGQLSAAILPPVVWNRSSHVVTMRSEV